MKTLPTIGKVGAQKVTDHNKTGYYLVIRATIGVASLIR